MKSSEMLDLDRAMTPADQWEAEDSTGPVTSFKIPDTVGITAEMLTPDALGVVTMRRLWHPLAKLVAACERRALATCLEDKVIGPYHFTGCCNGQHAPGCTVHKAEADVTSALAAVHATRARGNHLRKVPQEENLRRSAP
jgi:hypothetical protein